MSQTDTQERTTIGLQKDVSETSSVEDVLMYAANSAWLIGWLGLGIAFVTALTSPPRIILQAGGSIIIEGVDFRFVLGSMFLMGSRTIVPGLIWIWKKIRTK